MGKIEALRDLFLFESTFTRSCSECNPPTKYREEDTVLRLFGLPNGPTTVNIDSLISRHGYQGTLCPVCKRSSNRWTTSKPPSVLLVQLPRYDANYKKSHAMISFKPLLKHPDIPATYHLKAVISHQGDGVSGHYKAFLQRDESWLECDDHRLRSVSFDKAVNVC